MRDIIFQGILDVEAFNLSVRSSRDNDPHVVLLDPEGCTSSKLPARLDGEVYALALWRAVGAALDKLM